LKCSITEGSAQTSILGCPRYYQGENEVFLDDKFEPENHLLSNNVMIFQCEFGEGHVHFWVDKEELKQKNFKNCFCDYSGT
jgi:hypothetical protein